MRFFFTHLRSLNDLTMSRQVDGAVGRAGLRHTCATTCATHSDEIRELVARLDEIGSNFVQTNHQFHGNVRMNRQECPADSKTLGEILLLNPTEPAVTVNIVADGTPQHLTAAVGEELRHEVEFGVGGLPRQEV